MINITIEQVHKAIESNMFIIEWIKPLTRILSIWNYEYDIPKLNDLKKLLKNKYNKLQKNASLMILIQQIYKYNFDIIQFIIDDSLTWKVETFENLYQRIDFYYFIKLNSKESTKELEDTIIKKLSVAYKKNNEESIRRLKIIDQQLKYHL